ncbi:MAG: hypothetical protein EZS28_017516 [Streblomastix strix]|uniref:Uncharacterized protein n=1 Tax=Streblomastix strix TaxID=222440 RepID=A0A5J4VWJ5_9EUKA|nr:MAG: hypothetical protein EZS28_017516 [Streblomastix strix]
MDQDQAIPGEHWDQYDSKILKENELNQLLLFIHQGQIIFILKIAIKELNKEITQPRQSGLLFDNRMNKRRDYQSGDGEYYEIETVFITLADSGDDEEADYETEEDERDVNGSDLLDTSLGILDDCICGVDLSD